MHVIGRVATSSTDRDETDLGAPSSGGRRGLPTGHLGRYLARDGSVGAAVGIDLDRPHAGLVVGKRGAGKSHTLGVLAEAAARTSGVAPVVVDPMDAFAGLAAPADGAPVPAQVVDDPRVRVDALPPGDWPALVGLDPESSAGGVVWAAATEASTLPDMGAHVADMDASRAARRVATNHLQRAAEWGVFDPAGLSAADLLDDAVTVLSLAGVDDAPASAVVAAVASLLYDARVDADGAPAGTSHSLPWLLVDEAHVALDGVAAGPLRTLLTRGRAPGVSLVLATQRPAALPSVAVSQADLLVAHRLTSEPDVDALEAARPTFFDGSLRERLPTGVGEALVVDDATESTHTVRVRERDTPHGGATPRAVNAVRGDGGQDG